MSSTYRVLLYLRISDNLYLVDTIYGEDEATLLAMISDRKRANPNYIAILLSYNLVAAKIVNVESQNVPETISG